jgi:hypothetical protein
VPSPRQAEILEFYRAGHHATAFAMQLDLEGGRLRRQRGLALRRLDRTPLDGRMPIFACGIYHPLKGGLHAAGESVPGLGCSYSQAILRLKALRRGAGKSARGAGAAALTDFFAARLAHAFIRLLARGLLDAHAPVAVSPVPGSGAGPLSYGLGAVVERACALAGSGFQYRPLLYRGESVPGSRGGLETRLPELQVRSLMPVRDPSLKHRMLLLVDDVVSSGTTLRAAGALLGLYNEARGLGLALAKTEAAVKDRSGAEIL